MRDEDPESQTGEGGREHRHRQQDSGRNRLSRRGEEEEGRKNGDTGGCQMGREGGIWCEMRGLGGRGTGETGMDRQKGTQDPADLNLELRPGWGRKAERTMFTPTEEGKALHLRCPSGGRSGGECQAHVALSA